GGTADRNRSHWSTSKTPSYTKSVSWQHHHIFDHIFAIVEEFGLRLHQSLTGNDIRSLAGAFKQ
ncbi:hypothetical protein NY759_06290, partial [Escherichia coli]|nr:hypothetical protein [Escherichia coli]